MTFVDKISEAACLFFSEALGEYVRAQTAILNTSNLLGEAEGRN